MSNDCNVTICEFSLNGQMSDLVKGTLASVANLFVVSRLDIGILPMPRGIRDSNGQVIIELHTQE